MVMCRGGQELINLIFKPQYARRKPRLRLMKTLHRILKPKNEEVRTIFRTLKYRASLYAISSPIEPRHTERRAETKMRPQVS